MHLLCFGLKRHLDTISPEAVAGLQVDESDSKHESPEERRDLKNSEDMFCTSILTSFWTTYTPFGHWVNLTSMR